MVEKKKKDIMTHIVAGYPSLDANRRLIAAMAESGVRYIEIQIPFSDPIADGPTILKANQASLQKGMTLEGCFRFAAEMSARYPEVNFLFMTYYNILFRYGVKRFMGEVKKAGLYGLIVPDIPPEEDHEDYYACACSHGLHAVPVVSPTTSPRRLETLLKKGSGLIYCTSRIGITGTGKSLSGNLAKYVRAMKKKTEMPVAVGFGIDSPRRAAEVAAYADIIVIGSKILKIVESEGKGFAGKVKDFLASVSAEL